MHTFNSAALLVLTAFALAVVVAFAVLIAIALCAAVVFPLYYGLEKLREWW